MTDSEKGGFQKRVEDFVCEKCGTEVRGVGYTNHCPLCLWSKHVDNEPGDRTATCCGMMKPVRAEGAIDDLSLVHQCTNCGVEKRNKVAPNDSFEAITALSSES